MAYYFQYFIVILAILIGECAIYTIAWAWPSCMGIGLYTEDLVKALQSKYGSAGQEQFTAAMDLAQSTVIQKLFLYYHVDVTIIILVWMLRHRNSRRI